MKTRNDLIARKLARQKWGEVQRQEKYGEGIWWFDCCAHGGYIIDTDVYKFLKDFNEFVYCRRNGRYGYTEEQHFAAFEEDCDFNIINYVLFDEVGKKLYKYRKNEEQSFEIFKEQILNEAAENIRRWYPEKAECYLSLKEKIKQ